jgi:hypothetical protein
MWLARILGRVTSAETAAPGSSASRNSVRRFKRSLAGKIWPKSLHARRIVEVSGKITIAE